MALVQLVVALCLLVFSLANKDMKMNFMSGSASKYSAPQTETGQQKGKSEARYHDSLERWAVEAPKDDRKVISFSPNTEQKDETASLEFFARGIPEKLLAGPPPLDKIGGGFYTRELKEPDFEASDSLQGINGRFLLQKKLVPSYGTVNGIGKSDSDNPTGLTSDEKDAAAKRLDAIDKTAFRPAYFGGNGRYRKSSLLNIMKNYGSSFNSWEKKNFDEINRSGFDSFGKRNFDEIDRSSFHSFGKRRFDMADRSELHNLLRRNFDEIDKAGFRILGRRNSHGIGKSAFRDVGKRDFDEIDKSGFRDFGKRNIDDIDLYQAPDLEMLSPEEPNTQVSLDDLKDHLKNSSRNYKDGNKEFVKRNFDEIDRSGFRSFSKRDVLRER